MSVEGQPNVERNLTLPQLPLDGDTLPKLLRKRYFSQPDRVVMRAKNMGIWKEYTFRDYYERVKCFSLGLVSMGFERGQNVCIIGENKPEWVWAELAVQSAGGTAAGVFVDCSPQEVEYYAKHSGSTFFVVHDQEQADKLLEIKDDLPLLRKVIYWDSKGMWSYDDEILMRFDDVVELGRAYDRDHPGFFDEMVDQGKGEDIAFICYTSGTTGLPKGVMYDYKRSISGLIESSKLDGWYGKDYDYVSFISPAWVTEQWYGIAGSIVADLVTNFVEKAETVQEDLREIGPHFIFYGARLWESVNRTVQARMLDASWIRGLIYNTFLPVGLRMANIKIAGQQPSLWWRGLSFIAYLALFRSLRDRLGLKKIKVPISAGGALSPEIIRYFKALGINIKLVYGLTETQFVSIPYGREIRLETSGQIVPWAEARIAEDGEILVKSKYLFVGYYKDPEATEKKFKDGWFCTGDFGYLDKDGYMTVIDRMQDLKPLAGGKQFSPQYVEVRLRFSRFIKDAVAVGGEKREFVGALVNIDIENVRRYADAHRINYTTFTDLSQKPEVINLVMKEIRKINRTLPEHARLRRFINLHKELDPDESELTRTQKLRRSFVEDRYKDMIDALYGDVKEVTVEANVTYRDGRTGVVRTDIKINFIED